MKDAASLAWLVVKLLVFLALALQSAEVIVVAYQRF